MDHSKKRPVIPGTTPATVAPNRNSAYTCMQKPRFEDESRGSFSIGLKSMNSTNSSVTSESTSFGGNIIDMQSMQSTSNRSGASLNDSIRIDAQEKYILKLISGLPYNLRENISSTLKMMAVSADSYQKNCELSSAETNRLRHILKKKDAEIELQAKSCDIYKEKLRNLENTLDSLKDNIDTRQKFAVRNKKAIDRLASTNRMLIDSLDALQPGAERSHSAESASLNNSRANLLKPISGSGSSLQNGLEPPSQPLSEMGSNQSNVSKTNANNANDDSLSKMTLGTANSQTALTSDKNGQLRESLLRVAREHYRSVKSAEALEVRVEELQAKLKFNERKNKQLVLELDELRILQNVDMSTVVADLTVLKEPQKGPVVDLQESDERLDAILKRQAADPTDLLLQMRFMIGQIVNCPSTLLLQDVCNHITARNLSKVFDCELLVIYLLSPNLKNTMEKYTIRSSTPENVFIGDTNCILTQVLSTGHAIRNNNISKYKLFNISVDSCPGIVPSKLMCLPIKDKIDDKVIGALSMINRLTTTNDFSEADELIAALYAESIAPLINSCELYRNIKTKSHLLRSLLEASTSVYDAVPASDSMATNKFLNPSDVLTQLEDVIHHTLKTSKCRAFLLSDLLPSSVGFEGGKLISLDHKEVKAVPIESGIAGLVARTTRSYRNSGAEDDDILNPQVDLQPNEADSLYTVPVKDLNNRVVAVIQAIPGAGSPKEKLVHSNDTSDLISFSDAFTWLAHQVAAPVNYLLQSVGRPASRPPSTPHRISSNGNLFDNSSRSVSPMNKMRRSNSQDRPLYENATTVNFADIRSGFEIDPNEHEKLKSELDEAKSQISSISSSVESLNEKISKYNTDLDRAKNEKVTIQEDLDYTTTRLNNIIEEKLKLERRVLQMESDVKAAEDKVISMNQMLENIGSNQGGVVEELTKRAENAELQSKEIKLKCEQILETNRNNNADMVNKMAALEDELMNKDAEISNFAEIKSGLENEVFRSVRYQEMHHASELANQELQTQLQNLRTEMNAQQDQISLKDKNIKALQDLLTNMSGDSLQNITSAMTKIAAANTATSSPSIKAQPASGRRGPPDSAPPTRPATSASRGNDPWDELRDDNGNVYYQNRETGETSWSKPEAQAASQSGEMTVGDWSRQYDDAGYEYWVNNVTGESAWEIPQEANQGLANLALMTNRTNGGATTGRSSHTTGGYTIEL